MAKRDKNKLYYEITKEKPYSSFQVLMFGGSAGSVLGFLISSLVGAYEGMEMDSLVFIFLVSSILGFFFGLLLTWLIISHFEKFVLDSFLIDEKVPSARENNQEPIENTKESPVVEDDEAKGKSVDFVFPELSPDKQ